MLFESDRPNLTVYHKEEVIASFQDGKFATDDKKTIKILLTVAGVHEVEPADELNGEDYFDSQKFNKRAGINNKTETDDVQIDLVKG